MADHVDELEEIRRLQAGQFDSGVVIPLNEHCSRAYLSTLAVVRRAWEDFHMEFRQPGQRDAWSEVPNPGQVMAFLQWCLLRRQGKISGKVTTTTLKKYLVQLNKLFCDKLDRGIPPSHFLKLTKFIGEGLVRKGASQEAMARPVATPAVVTDILYFLWALDEHEFDHPRIRLQISFSIMILLYFGIRPGEFIESSAHAGNNEGLLYKDLDIMIMSNDGRRRIGIEVVLRNRKGARGKRVKDISMLLLEDHEKPELCPVAQLLAMALADNALQDVKCAADMRSIAAPPPGVFKRLRITDDMRQTPILRRLTRRGQGLSPDKIFTCKELGPMMEALGYRAGHRERFMPYAIRRGHGALLDRSVSGAVRQKRMGHQHESQFQHYINRFSAVDGQSMVLDRPMEQEIVDRLASMATTVDVNAPKPHRACLTDVGRQDKRAGLRAHRAMRQEYFDSSEAFASTTVTKTPEDDKSAQMVEEIARGRPPPSKMFQMYLRWDSPRSEIIQMFYNREPDQKAQLEDILEPLASIACPDRTTWRYPRTTVTTDGLCPCGTRQKRPRDTFAFNNHLLCCHLAARRKGSRFKLTGKIEELYAVCPWPACKSTFPKMTLESIADHVERHLDGYGTHCPWSTCFKTFLTLSEFKVHMLRDHYLPLPDTLPRFRYCYDCREYYPSMLEWDEHCQTHLEGAGMFCGQVLRRNVAITACRCPFCLGAASLPPSRRASPHLLGSKFYDHLVDHLRDITSWPFECPHPLCQHEVSSVDTFWDHLHADHSIERPAVGSSALRASQALATIIDGDCATADEAASSSLECGTGEGRSGAGARNVEDAMDQCDSHGMPDLANAAKTNIKEACSNDGKVTDLMDVAGEVVEESTADEAANDWLEFIDLTQL